MFTLDELNSLKVGQLVVLAKYFGITFDEEDAQDTMVKILYEHIKRTTVSDPPVYGEVQMSVRIRRIKEGAKNE